MYTYVVLFTYYQVSLSKGVIFLNKNEWFAISFLFFFFSVEQGQHSSILFFYPNDTNDTKHESLLVMRLQKFQFFKLFLVPKWPPLENLNGANENLHIYTWT